MMADIQKTMQVLKGVAFDQEQGGKLWNGQILHLQTLNEEPTSK